MITAAVGSYSGHRTRLTGQLESFRAIRELSDMGAVVKGYLIFNGGEAFTPRSRMSDHIWLELIRGVHRPRLVVVPVAAMEKHQRIADQTMRYFLTWALSPNTA
jgi:hypothetical protein